MGRYYNTSTGREGKFMFAVQPSNDPEIMGMREIPCINFYADQDDEETIKKKLDNEYDALGIPKKDRIYYIKVNGWEEYDKYEKEHFNDKVFDYIKLENEDEIKKYNQTHRYVSDREGFACFASNEKALHLARIRLALVILSDIKDEGCCELEAET